MIGLDHLEGRERPLADQWTLMSHPPRLRRGVSQLIPVPSPPAGAGYTRKVDNTWWERVISLYFTFAAAAGSNPRQVVINMLSADGAVFNSTPAVLAAQGGETWSVSADLSGTPGLVAVDSIGAQGTVTTPAAGAAITSAPIGPGVWTVSWNVSLSGTVGAPEANNFKVTTTGVNWETSDNPASVGGPWSQNSVQVDSPAGGTTISIKAVALATTGAVYDAAFTAVPAGSTTTYPQLPDITLRPGWQLQVAVAGIQAGDQLSGIQLLVEQYPSDYADGTRTADLEAVTYALDW